MSDPDHDGEQDTTPDEQEKTGGPEEADASNRSWARRTTRRGLLVTAGAAAGVLLGASAVFACTNYMGWIEVDNIDDTASALKLVGTGSGMDRCESDTAYSAGDTIEGYNDSGDDASKGPDTLRIRVGKHGKGEGDCGADNNRLSSDEDVFINVDEDNSYDDENFGQEVGRYEDSDCGLLCESGESNERELDCMGDGSDWEAVKNKEADVPIDSEGEFDASDDRVTEDTDNGNYVDIQLDEAADTDDSETVTDDDGNTYNRYASAICVSQQDEGESAPQFPLIIK